MLKTIGSYALGGIGLAMMLIALTSVVAANLDYAAARYRLVNLLRTSANQAEFLVKSAPMTFFEPIAMVMGGLAMSRSQDPALIAKLSAPTYDGCCQGMVAKWAALLMKAKLGMMAVGGGLALGLSKDSFPILLTIVTALAGIAFLWIYLRKVEMEKSLLRARAEILPEVDRAFIEGRYVYPPQPTM